MFRSQTRVVAGDAWIPTYPPFTSTPYTQADTNPVLRSIDEAKSFWNRNAEVHEEKVFRGNSPLKLLRSKEASGEDLDSTTMAVPAGSSAVNKDIDGEPIAVTHPRSNIPSNLSPPKAAAGKPPLPASTTPNRWRENLKSPPTATVFAMPSVVNTPSRPPLHPTSSDYGATIPILPSNANHAWPPPKTPTESTYQTPKPTDTVAKEPRQPQSNYPASAFVPRYTPAPGPVEIVTENLVPLMSDPLPEDQYEMTEWEDSDAEKDEDAHENKRVPAWCIGWIETAKTQTSIDPDTVFGSRIPKCELEVLFGRNGNAYLKARKGKRGSSGEWGMDDVSMRELDEYRQLMGHTQQLDSVVILKSLQQVYD